MPSTRVLTIVETTRDITDCSFDHPVRHSAWGKTIRGSNRECHARHVAIYVTRQLTNRSMPEIARDFGYDDHTTILHALRKVRDDVKLRALADEVIAKLSD